MPFASKAQQRYFYANREKLEKEGVDVAEWSKETDFGKLPEKVATFWATEYFKYAASVPQRLRSPPSNVGGLGSLVQRVGRRKGIFSKVGNFSVSGKGPTPSGTWAQPPLTTNPYATDPEQAIKFENGYEYALTMGPQEIRMTDTTRWRRSPTAWREGFAHGAKAMGAGDIQL